MEILNLKKTLKKAISFLLTFLIVLSVSGEGLFYMAEAIGEAVYAPMRAFVTDGNVTDGNVTDGNATYIIESITIDPKVIIEGTEGYYVSDGYYDEETDTWIDLEHFEYSTDVDRMTVNFTNGRSLVYSGIGDFVNDWGLEFYCDDPQDKNNSWGVGTHKVTYTFEGDRFFRADMIIEIIETPIDRIEIPTVYLCEGENGYLSKGFYTDEASGNEVPFEYYRYHLEDSMTVRVCYKDGSVRDFDYYDFAGEYDCRIEIADNQSPTNPWIKGNKYKTTFEAMGFRSEFDVEFCEHKETADYPAVSANCKNAGYTEGTYCSTCKTWIDGRERIPKVSYIDENGDAICDSCGKTISFSRYYDALNRFTYDRDCEFDKNTNPDDYFVWNYLYHKGYFDDYLIYDSYGPHEYKNVPYAVFMQKADENFANHSDMIDFFTDNGMFTDESKQYLEWTYGGKGGISIMNLTSVYNCVDGTVVLRGFISDIADYVLKIEDDRYIRRTYEYVTEFGETISGEGIGKVVGAYELTVRDTDKAVQLISFREIKSYIHDRTLFFIKEHNLRDKYYRFDVECGEGASVVTGNGALTDEFLTFDKYNHFWFAPGSEYSFRVNVEGENELVSVVLCDNKGETQLVPSSAGEYSVSPDGPAVLKVITKADDVHEHSYSEKVILEPTCEADGTKELSCSCGDSYTETIPATGHSFGEWITAEGKAYCECKNCGFRKTMLITEDGNIEIESSGKESCDFEAEDVIKGDDRYLLVENSVYSNYDSYVEILKVFDITYKNKDGVHIQPKGTVKVKLPLDWEKDGKYKVYRINDDGTLTDMNACREGSHMVFETDHFSIYVIVDENADVPEENENNNRLFDFIHKMFGWLTKLFDFFADFIKSIF